MMTMVLQEYNGGHEVVVGWTDTGTGGWGSGRASLHSALAEKEWLATLVSTELSQQSVGPKKNNAQTQAKQLLGTGCSWALG